MNARNILRVLLCLAFCGYLLAMISQHLQCGSPCDRQFSESAALGRHRRACKHYKHRLHLQAEHFKRASEDPKHRLKVFKRMNPALATPGHQVSTNCMVAQSIITDNMHSRLRAPYLATNWTN